MYLQISYLCLHFTLTCSLQQGTEEKFYTEWEESYDSFDQMGLHENLLRGIYAYGTHLSPSSLHLNQLSAELTNVM